MAVYAQDVQYTLDGMPLLNSEGASIARLSLVWPFASIYCKTRSWKFLFQLLFPYRVDNEQEWGQPSTPGSALLLYSWLLQKHHAKDWVVPKKGRDRRRRCGRSAHFQNKDPIVVVSSGSLFIMSGYTYCWIEVMALLYNSHLFPTLRDHCKDYYDISSRADDIGLAASIS